MPVLTGAVQYPENIVDTMRALGAKVVAFDALSAAMEAGSPKCANVALLGAAAAVIGHTQQEWQAALTATIKPKLLDLNLKAFSLGQKAG